MIDFDEPVYIKISRFIRVMSINMVGLGILLAIIKYTEYIHGDVKFWENVFYWGLGGMALNIIIFSIAYIGSEARAKERLRQQLRNEEMLKNGNNDLSSQSNEIREKSMKMYVFTDNPESPDPRQPAKGVPISELDLARLLRLQAIETIDSICQYRMEDFLSKIRWMVLTAMLALLGSVVLFICVPDQNDKSNGATGSSITSPSVEKENAIVPVAEVSSEHTNNQEIVGAITEAVNKSKGMVLIINIILLGIMTIFASYNVLQSILVGCDFLCVRSQLREIKSLNEDNPELPSHPFFARMIQQLRDDDKIRWV